MTHAISLTRRLTLGATAALALAVLAPAAHARLLTRGWSNASDALTTRYLKVEVLENASFQPLPIFAQRQAYVGGEAGMPYRIRLTNRTPRRLLVVTSVDGINVLTGQNAGSFQSGYILEPYAQTSIDGWRKSLQEVAQFVLTEPSAAYAAQTGRPANVGVIGFAVFEEAPVYVPPPVVTTRPQRDNRLDQLGRELGMSSSQDSAVMEKRAPSAGPSLGTGHGQRQDSYAVRGTFERASQAPAAVVSLRYDSLRNLEAAGIAQRARWEQRMEPSPFPADHGFVPDPPRR